ncbi:His-Xaa-Ser system protein HxsD [Dysgonomonas mossii]|uniref:His-Xaa-Ser system protein HxsD n=1 Tax=Dysgonomonas mossii TaxID=163665 RepID=A0A4Y9IKX4_9BACT|nr:His-Xaa-Ser system protein HxsD [Dysgonomonas mossii]MBF0761364.1 His-Xaa-Ser system protein HxsD [Dysgonomonas mossii]TFU89001.1 His-Xaa-Ser system protein HxsD [Dysgonomonas mossii]
MTDFRKIAENFIRFSVDTQIYNDTVISKVLYWLTDSYLISRNTSTDTIQSIELKKKEGIFIQEEIDQLERKLNQDFIDYKVRDIVGQETHNIRDILYVKAFANNDEFEDYMLTGE